MKILKIYDFLTLLLLLCIPIEPLVGKFFQIFIYAYIMLFIMLYILWQKNNNKEMKFAIIFALFVCFSCFSILYTGDAQSTSSMARQLITNTLLAMAVSFRLRDNVDAEIIEKRIDKYFHWFTIGSTIITIYLLIFCAPHLKSWERLGGDLFLNYGSHMVYSYSLIISICYLISCILLSDKIKKIKINKLIMLIILIIGALVSGTRKSIICPILFLVILSVLKNARKIHKIFFSVLLVSSLLFAGYKVVMNNEMLYTRIGVRIENLVDSVSDKGTDEGSINERKLLRDLSIELFKKKPIGGYGLHAFRSYSYSRGGPFLYAHCNYTELLADLGIIGFSIYYISYFILILSAKKNKNVKKYAIAMLSFLIMNLISDYSTISYYRHHYLIVFFIFATYLEMVPQSKSVLKLKGEEKYDKN